MADTIDFFQIYWHEEQLPMLFPFAKQYYNAGLNPFFENSVIKKVVPESKADKIAVTSCYLRQKMTFRVPPRRDLTLNVLQEDFQVLSLSKNAPDHDMFAAAEAWHPGWKAAFFKIWEKIYGVMPAVPKQPIYQNAFVAQREIYQSYLKEFLIPAMEMMEKGGLRFDDKAEDEEMKRTIWVDSGYRQTVLGFHINTKKCQEYFGVPWYPLHPFLLERAFSCWLDLHPDIKVTYL